MYWTGKCPAVIRLSRDPTRRTSRRSDERRGSDGGSVSALLMRLCIPLPDLCAKTDGVAAAHAFHRARVRRQTS